MEDSTSSMTKYTGYMLFVRIFSRWYYGKPDDDPMRWGLQAEFNRPFLGLAAKLWSFVTPMEKYRWKELAENEYLKLLNYTTEASLVMEMDDHVRSVLKITLLAREDERIHGMQGHDPENCPICKKIGSA